MSYSPTFLRTPFFPCAINYEDVLSQLIRDRPTLPTLMFDSSRVSMNVSMLHREGGKLREDWGPGYTNAWLLKIPLVSNYAIVWKITWHYVTRPIFNLAPNLEKVPLVLEGRLLTTVIVKLAYYAASTAPINFFGNHPQIMLISLNYATTWLFKQTKDRTGRTTRKERQNKE